MDYKDKVDALREKMTDSREENEKILKAEGEKYAKSGDVDGLKAVGELLIENMTEESRNELNRLTHVDGMRLDELHNKILKLIDEKKHLEAVPLAERLYKKITVEYAPTEKSKFVSLRNPFEDNLCQLLFKDDRILNRTPFDFSQYITTYAYLLVDTGATVNAIPVLEKAIEYNPVDVGPRFELCEIYKIIHNKKMVLQTTRETLQIASSPIAIARCYANVGYALTDSGDYEDAAAFYVASVMFAPNPAVPLEMKHLTDLKGTPIIKPSREKMIEVMKKYEMEYGPSKPVIEVAAALATHYIKINDIPNALNALKITYNLTLDQNVKKLILSYEPMAKIMRPDPKNVDAAQINRSNITQTKKED